MTQKFVGNYFFESDLFLHSLDMSIKCFILASDYTHTILLCLNYTSRRTHNFFLLFCCSTWKNANHVIRKKIFSRRCLKQCDDLITELLRIFLAFWCSRKSRVMNFSRIFVKSPWARSACVKFHCILDWRLKSN